ncbi:MAG: uroporphyrinogen-III synthase [Proteobacteria bacterium]|nr:uroporphyrinogen-III synthase [Pseudomonadota bacterium]
MTSVSLTGLNVLVTRPQQQQQSICAAIEAAGGKAIKLPLIEINPLVDASAIQALKSKFQRLDNYQILIFVSSNAVSYGTEWAIEFWPQLPINLSIVAVGPSTARAVATALGCSVIRSEAGVTSEDLLKLPVLNDVHEQRIGIVRGEGGRELLAETLRARGAVVEYLEVYRRTPIRYDATEFYQLIKADAVNVLSVTSTESLDRLIVVLGDNKEELTLLPLLVPSARVALQARQSGFSKVIDANGADVAAFIAALESLADKVEY